MKKQYYMYVLRLVARYRNQDNWNDETRSILSAHYNYLKSHTDSGRVLVAGRTAYEVEREDNMGIVVFEAQSLEEAQLFMENDPTVAHGIMQADVHPFSLAMLKASVKA